MALTLIGSSPLVVGHGPVRLEPGRLVSANGLTNAILPDARPGFNLFAGPQPSRGVACSTGPTPVTTAVPRTISIGGDVEVLRLGFGALHLCGPGALGEPADRDGAVRVLRRAVELGVGFIDTADSYGPEVSERIVAEALYPYPDGVLIATKGGMVRNGPADEMWPADGRPEHLRTACEASLKRLRVDRIDLYQLHTVDPAVPIEESIGALVELQAAGKVRHIGVSNVSVADLERARAVAAVVSVQNRFSVAYRLSADVLAACSRDNLTFIPWQPLNLGRHGGMLTQVAAAHGATPRQAALAWLLQSAPVVLPIPGTRSIEHLEENLAALGLRLSDEEVAFLEREIPSSDPARDPPHPARSRSAHAPEHSAP
jgi:aryl-alcohol dehydrogenase-like predicted oxidoreductase